MDPDIVDNPQVLSILFHPRRASMAGGHRAGVLDGAIPVEAGVVLGYRLYVHQPSRALIVFFHGNGEIAPDYDDMAPLYHRAGASLLVIDYRGYGWSTGKPLISAIPADVAAVAAGLSSIVAQAGLGTVMLVAMGRSLGSAYAIELAHLHPELLKGLIIESGFSNAIALLARLGMSAAGLAGLPDPIGNARKLEAITLPLLVIHGERDVLIPHSNGEELFRASAAKDKRMLSIRRAGHNDLLYYGMAEYFAAVAQFVSDVAAPYED
jgi:hypothetical protein